MRTLFLCFCLLFVYSQAKAEHFSSYIEDLPYPKGLYEQPSEDVLVFDKPSARFVEFSAYAEALQKEDVLSFYKQALPALGWQKKNTQTYIKQDEILKINIEQDDSLLRVIFTLSPA